MSKDKEIQKKNGADIIENTPINDEQQKNALIAAVAKSFAGAVPGLREFIGVVNNINAEVREEKLKNLDICVSQSPTIVCLLIVVEF